MKVIIAPGSFKGSLSAGEVSQSIGEGFREVIEDAEITILPMADGGEGTVEAIVEGSGGRYVDVPVRDPLGRPIKGKYGVVGEEVAVIEMAMASGLMLLEEHELNPLITTTYGTGEMIRSALESGFKKIYVGLGGSATNDGGLGMAQALGYSFLDHEGNELGFGGLSLGEIDRIDSTNKHHLLESAEIIVLSDVTNPLCGINGASHVYGPQKGATEEMILELDRNLKAFSNKLREQLDVDIEMIVGSGAAGGLGGGMIAFCNASIEPGVERVMDILDLDTLLEDADLVITGEGKIDSQSIYGKVPVGVAKRAKKHGKPVIVISGSKDDNIDQVYDAGIDLVLDIIHRPMSLEYAMENARGLLIESGKMAARIWRFGRENDENIST